MIPLFRWFLAILLSLTALNINASPVAPQSNVDYKILEARQPTDTGKKVEVIEFFGYFCSYCYAFDGHLLNWAKKQGNNIVFKRVAVGFNDAMQPQQRMFYALTAMGKLTNELHKKIFHAVQVQQVRLKNDNQVFDFITKLGIDRNKFMEMYNSFSVQVMLDSAAKLQTLYKIESVPAVIIDGQFATSPAIVAEGNKLNAPESEIYAATLKVMDHLVDRAHKERNADGETGAKKISKKK